MPDINIQLENLEKLKRLLLDKYLEADNKWRDFLDLIGGDVLSDKKLLIHKQLIEELSGRKYIYDTFNRNSFAIENLVHALKDLYENDENLINQSGQERAISSALAHRMGMYFENTYDIDCEYNKHLNEQKLITQDAKRSERPDIIVHMRGTDAKNLLALEIKQNEISKADKDKLSALSLANGQYIYKFAIGIEINDIFAHIYIYIDGECINISKIITR